MSLNSELAADLVSQFPNAPSATLARRLYRENPILFRDVEAARGSIRYVRGNKGKVHRAHANERFASCKKAPGKAGWKPACPPAKADEWVPYALKQPSRVLVLSDIHIPFHDKPALEAAVSFGVKLNPSVVLLNGDVADFYNVSKWVKNPKFRDMKGELILVEQFLDWLRQKFPRSKIVYKMGNHEERWDVFIWNKAPEIWNLDCVQMHNLLHFEKRRIIRVDDEPVMAGALPIFHGHEFQTSANNPVNPARGAFLRAGGSCLIGHHHRTSSHCEADWDHTETATWSQGCLCDLSPKYARVNSWNHGFAYIRVAKNGEYDMQNFRISKSLKVRPS